METTVDIARFETEHFYAPYEFSVPHMLSSSDCETVSVAELLELAGLSLETFGELRLHYTEPLGHPDLRRAIAATYDAPTADDVMVLATPIEGIYLAMRALLEPGDEAIVMSPCYDALFNVAEHCAEKVHRWELVPGEDGWSMDLDALDELPREALEPMLRLLGQHFAELPPWLKLTVC